MINERKVRRTRAVLLAILAVFLMGGVVSGIVALRVGRTAKATLDELPNLERKARSLGLPLTIAEADALVQRPGGEAAALQYEEIGERIRSMGGATFYQRDDAVRRAAGGNLSPDQAQRVVAPYDSLLPAILQASRSNACRFRRKNNRVTFDLSPKPEILAFSCRLLVANARVRIGEDRRQEGLRLLASAARICDQLTNGPDLGAVNSMAARRTILRNCLGIVQRPWAADPAVQRGLLAVLSELPSKQDARKSLVANQVAYGCEVFQRIADPRRDRFRPETETALSSVPKAGLKQFGLIAKAQWLEKWCDAYPKIPPIEEDWKGFEQELVKVQEALLQTPWPLPTLYGEFFVPKEEGRFTTLYATNLARERLVRLALTGWTMRDGALVGKSKEVIDPLSDKPFHCESQEGAFILRTNDIPSPTPDDPKKPIAITLPQSQFRIRHVGDTVVIERPS